MFYLFHGEDEYGRSLQLEQMKAKLGDPTTVALNTTELSGRRLNLDELIFACDAIPFLGERRLVIVNDLATRFERDAKSAAGRSDEDANFLQRFKEYVATLPDTTRLVLMENRRIKKANPISKIVSHSDHGYEEEFGPLRGRKLNDWIVQRAEDKGGRIEPPAVNLLATFVGGDLRLLDQEIEKLRTYVGGERAINVEDVERLVSYVQEANIFHMVDALGRRDTRRAMELLEQLLQGGRHPLYVLRMITRQFRILLQIKELRARGTLPADIAALLRLPPFVVDKTSRQAGNFSFPQLEDTYRRLLELDAAVKSGEIEDRLALNLFVTEVRR
jgi:DNA polymerase-3 subunit delta